jgi:hypothetical protein
VEAVGAVADAARELRPLQRLHWVDIYLFCSFWRSFSNTADLMLENCDFLAGSALSTPTQT